MTLTYCGRHFRSCQLVRMIGYDSMLERIVNERIRQ